MPLLIGRPGLEPGIQDPKSYVLPLHHQPKNEYIVIEHFIVAMEGTAPSLQG